MTEKLIVGEDYTIEKGLWVFTAKYHLKRGACCKSNCRHCPYGYRDSIEVKSLESIVKIVKVNRK